VPSEPGSVWGNCSACNGGDCDFQGRYLHIQRNYTHWKITTPKSGHSRRVDMSRELCQALKDLHLEGQIEAAARKWKTVPEWVFCNETGGLLHPHNMRDRVFYGLLIKAKLRKVRFHDLRHTFASLLLQNGESPVYVKEQMGHSSIQVTVDLYGHLIPGGNKQAVDRLDEDEILKPSKPGECFVSVATQQQQPVFLGVPPHDMRPAETNEPGAIGKNAPQAHPA
jgi:integrase